MLGNNSYVVYHVSLLPRSCDNYLLLMSSGNLSGCRSHYDTMYNPRIYLWKQCAIHVTRGSSSEATLSESSLSTYIIVLEALLEAERDGVAAMNEVISILRLEIMQLGARIMQASQELE